MLGVRLLGHAVWTLKVLRTANPELPNPGPVL
jgi:hypothetical protein